MISNVVNRCDDQYQLIRKNMKLNGIVIKMLSEKAKIDVTTKAGAEFLRNDIESVTGEALSLNTIKRLTGILAYNSDPREITLDIIALYLGYKDYKFLLTAITNKISDFNTSSNFIDLNSQPVGKEIIIKWEPDRVIKIRHIGEGVYRVEESQNSKLFMGDLLTLSQISEGFPFMVKEVVRGGKMLGSYTAAQTEGVLSIEC